MAHVYENPPSGEKGGAAWIEQTLRGLSREDDQQDDRSADWDTRLAELTTPVKSRVPRIVEERCRNAQVRTNCGLIAEAKHAWVSADALLHIWDYRQDVPQVLVVPADSSIISVGFCPPRPGVFDGDVHLLVVLCTRMTVTLLGLSLTQRGLSTLGSLSGRPQMARSASWPAAPGLAAMSGASDTTGSLRLVQLDGFVARTNGALFHSVSHTADGHILLACGTPHVFELAYSRSPSWFHSKCRVVRHTIGVWGAFQTLVPLMPAVVGRVRFVQCATSGYAVSVDDLNTMRLFAIKDQAVHRAESVAVLEEVAQLNVNELIQQHLLVAKTHLSSSRLTHAFPVVGLDGHVRVHAVTSASERLLFVCSASSPTGPPSPETAAVESAAPAPTSPTAAPAKRHYGFWLQRVTESRLGHGGSSSSSGAGTWVPPTQAVDGGIFGSGVAASTRRACLEEHSEACVYSRGVWVAAARRAGVQVTEVGITVKVEDSAGFTGSPGWVRLFTSLQLNSQVLHVVEEKDSWVPDPAQPVGGCASTAEPDAEPMGFHSCRTFAVFLADSIQVLRLSLRPQSLSRTPATSSECCLHLVQLALPPADVVPAHISAGAQRAVAWSFDDVGIPSYEAQLDHFQSHRDLPPVHYGRWFNGLLQFLAVVLKPVWDVALVVPYQCRRRGVGLQANPDGLSLSIRSDTVQRILAQLKPALRFAHQGLVSTEQVPIATCAAARSVQFSHHGAHQALVEASGALRTVLEVADRAQQVMGLLSVLHAQRSAYRVLRSSVLAGGALESLMSTSLGVLVCSSESMAPIVQLCAALAVESGLTTPAAELVFDARSYPRPLPGTPGAVAFGARSSSGATAALAGGLERTATGNVCRDLEEQCPAIFAQVNLTLVESRLGTSTSSTSPAPGPASGVPAGAADAGELLRRYSQCVSLGAQQERWTALAKSLQSMAMQDTRSAADVCVEKLQQLQSEEATWESSGGAGEGSSGADPVNLLLEALLGAVGSQRAIGSSSLVDHATGARAIVEHLLTKTASLKLLRDRPAIQRVPTVHVAILDILLGSAGLRPVLEALLDTTATDIEAFLSARSTASTSAAELLCKLLIRQNRHSCASKVLYQLAERPGAVLTLQDRAHYLDSARQAASQSLPHSKEQYDRMGTQLAATTRVQLPLYYELGLIAADERIEMDMRRAAEIEKEKLQHLCPLQELHQVAAKFGLQHIAMVAAGMPGGTMPERQQGCLMWVHMFFPPSACPYASASTLRETKPLSGLFPMLFVRCCDVFFQQNDRRASGGAVRALCVADFRLRTSRLLEELRTFSQIPSSLWDVRVVVALLEYCHCLWLQAVHGRASSTSGPRGTNRPRRTVEGAGEPERETIPKDDTFAWVALDVLSRQPFNFAPTDIVRYYAEMSENITTWLPDLEQLIPPDARGVRRPIPGQVLRIHLCDVVLAAVQHWMTQAAAGHCSDRALNDVRAAFPAAHTIADRIENEFQHCAEQSVQQLLATAKQVKCKIEALEASGAERRPSLPESVGAQQQPTMPEPSLDAVRPTAGEADAEETCDMPPDQFRRRMMSGALGQGATGALGLTMPEAASSSTKRALTSRPGSSGLD